MKLFVSLILLVLATNGHAISYEEKSKLVRKFVREDVKQEYIQLSPNKKIFTIHFTPKSLASSDTVIFIVPGWSEPVLFYDELIYDLRNFGLPIIGYDHPSQGLSYRNLKDSGKTHVNSIDEYLESLQFVLKRKVQQYKNILVISHSMGSHIVARYEQGHPNTFKKIVMLSPLFQINTKFIPNEIARNVADKMTSLGLSEWYVAPKYVLNQFKYKMALNNGTRSKERFDGRNYWIKKYPKMISSGPTWYWLKMMIDADNEFMKSIDKLKLPPTALIQAGDDSVVKNSKQETFCKRIGCNFTRIEDSKHWIHRELDEVRSIVLDKITRHFNLIN